MSEFNRIPELQFNYLFTGRNGAATITARLGDNIVAHEKVDLSKPKARTEFTNSIVNGRPGINPADVERQLLKIAAESASRHTADSEDESTFQADAAQLLSAMPESIQCEARTMLESKDLLKRTIDDVGELGVAGERELVATIYLIGVSRLLPKPLAAIVQAASSVGKSYTVAKVAELFPPEAIIHATSLTPQALFYMEPGSLSHRFVVAGERSRKDDDEMAETTRALREILSSGRLTKLVPEKVCGKIVTQTIYQPGPIAHIETTTLTKIFDEDANRSLLLTADEREAQTRAVVKRLATGYAGISIATVDRIIQKHHAILRMLYPHIVVVPFAEQVAERFDTSRVEARRAFPHLMGMIQASALLHQYQRQFDGYGRLIADGDDYQIARYLVGGPLARLLGGRISDAALRFYDRLVAWAPTEFTTTDAVKHDRKTDRAVRGWLRELAEAGAIDQIEPGKGCKPAKWKRTGIDRRELVAGGGGLPETIA